MIELYLQQNYQLVVCFLDIVIGAPYGGEDGRGVIYVYEGSRSGLQSTISQVLL